jgi:hypothetical protein
MARAVVCRPPPGALAITAGTPIMDGRQEKHRHCMHSSARTQALQAPRTYPQAPQEYFQSLKCSFTSNPPRRTPSSFLTSLPGALQRCQMQCTCTKPQSCDSCFFPGQKRYHLIRWVVYISYHGPRTLKLRSH